MTSSSCDADVHGWDHRRDDLDGCIKHALKALVLRPCVANFVNSSCCAGKQVVQKEAFVQLQLHDGFLRGSYPAH